MDYFKISKFFLSASVFFVAIVSSSTLFPFIVGKYAFFRTTVGLALIFFLLGLLFWDKLSVVSSQLSGIFKQPLVIAVSFFVFIFVLACFFGIDPAISFWSNFERGEGGLQMIYLWIFFILAIALFREEKDWQKLFVFFLIAGLLMAFYGIGASLKYVDAEFATQINSAGVEEQVLTGKGGALYQMFKNYIGPSFSSPGVRFSGSIGNPAYVAAFSIFMMFYAVYLIAARYRRRLLSAGSITLFGIIIFFSAIFLLAATRGAFMGLIAAAIVFLSYFVFSKKELRKWLFPAIGIILITVSLMAYFKDMALVKSIPGSRIFDISLSAETWQHRTYMWKIAWDGFKERPLFGWGPENYIHVFSHNFNVNYYNPNQGFGAWFDRAHSVYFDYLAETGIFGLMSFLAIFGVFYWKILKFSKQGLVNSKQESVIIRDKKSALVTNYSLPITNALLFAMPVAYLVQGIVLFDVLPIYFNLFLFLAFAVYKFQYKFSKQELVNSKQGI